MDSVQPLVVARNLTKKYGGSPALEDCSLSIPRGEIFGLLGPNGSGKTTLLRLLMGFLRPTSGSASIAGRDCYAESVAVHAGVSYLPGDVRFSRGMRAQDILAFFSRVRGQRDSSAATRIAARLGLDLTRRTSQMSTGMRQKLALAVAFAVDPPLLILDEPTANLDPTVRNIVLELIRESRTHRRTVIFSSHVLAEIEQTCDRVVILRAGKIVHDEQVSNVRRGHRIHAKLTGTLPTFPPDLVGRVTIVNQSPNQIQIDAPGELAPLLGWLATLPLSEIRVEPIGLKAVYERYHRSNSEVAEVA
jgi:ABC-2 type transport system ATP-binding protein